jgi:cell volume regulation protein A
LDEIQSFAEIVLTGAAGITLALVFSKVSARFPIPSPALFLVAAAVASEVVPQLQDALSIQTVERIGVVALIVILLDGGMHVGWRRFRASATPIGLLGLAGTFGTAAVMAVLAHALFGFDWTTAWILGAALAPTDPAVMFSVLGNKEVGGRSGTILEGESGFNDPVGIALMIGLIEFATHDDGSVSTIVSEFAIQMAVGLAVGVAGAWLLLLWMRRVPLPTSGHYPIRVLAAAGVVYGAASVAHGSGFLAVFVTALLIGDARAPHKLEIERFHMALASLAEIAVFIGLGLTVDLASLHDELAWVDALALAALLIFVARPLAIAPLLAPLRLRLGEKVFVAWGGLRGAVPILLAAFAVLGGVDGAQRIYGIVFVVVAVSVIVQGSSIPFVAHRLRIPMRHVEHEPLEAIAPGGGTPNLRRFSVAPRARAVGHRISELPLGENVWITAVVRDGEIDHPGGSYVLESGDRLLVLAPEEAVGVLGRLFEGDQS